MKPLAVVEKIPAGRLAISPFWWAIVNLLITLYGVLFKGWSLQPIVFVFWMEVIFSVIAALIRVAGSMDRQPFFQTLGKKIVFLLGGAALGVAFILLSVSFTIKAFDGGFQAGAFADIRPQLYLLAANYALALLFHFFLNGRFREADPAAELMRTFVYLLVLLAVIMALTMHLLPRFPGLDQALWVGLAVLCVKFLVDLVFTKVAQREDGSNML